MKNYPSRAPLQKLVAQIDEAQTAIAELDEKQSRWTNERDTLLQSGKVDDENVLVMASTLGTKLAMTPHKRRQLQELVHNVAMQLEGPIHALMRELEEDRKALFDVAFDTLTRQLIPEIIKILGHNERLTEVFAEDIARNSLVCKSLASIDPIAAQGLDPAAARNMLGCADALDRIRRNFFPAGDKLDVAAVAKKTAFTLTPKS